MIAGMAGYVGGAIVGFTMGLLAMLALFPEPGLAGPVSLLASSNWLSLNLGSSTWLFGAVLIFYAVSLLRLHELMNQQVPLKRVVQLDQLSDVWIHLFIGIGVIWTAIGMRSALSTTLDAPGALGEDAGEVLGRLVDGGILLALTTTIVGAIGGYLMRLLKTLLLGAHLAEFYHREERHELQDALTQLSRIEAHLDRLGGASSEFENEPQPS